MPTQLEGSDDITIVSFASLGSINFDDINMEEFKKTLSNFNCRRVFVSDSTKRWYCYGVDDVLNGRDGAVSFLRDTIGTSKSIFLGHSMGGFGAIAYGLLCGASIVIAFSPQTHITLEDSRYVKYMKHIHNPINVLEIDNDSTKVVIVSATKDPNDSLHTKYVSEKNNFIFEKISNNTHNTAKYLKDRGELVSMIDSYYKELLN